MRIFLFNFFDNTQIASIFAAVTKIGNATNVRKKIK